MNSLWVCLGMQRPTTVPVSVFNAANKVVVPLRLSSCVIVPHLPGFSGKPGWVRSSAWILALLVDGQHHRMAGRVPCTARRYPPPWRQTPDRWSV